MNIRSLSGALIIRGNEYLLMKRADNRRIAPGMWAGVGGHVEPNEISSPKTTCLREIYEETGIEEEHFKKLDLKYIVLRRDKLEISVIYYFVGFVESRFYKDKSQEGKLHWINEKELLDRPMSFEIRKIIEHYKEIGHASNVINVGTISVINNKPIINWHSLDGWEGIIGT